MLPKSKRHHKPDFGRAVALRISKRIFKLFCKKILREKILLCNILRRKGLQNKKNIEKKY